MDCEVCGNPAYLLLVSSCDVPVPHHVSFFVAVEFITVNPRFVSVVCQVVALGVVVFQFVLSGMVFVGVVVCVMVASMFVLLRARV